SNAASHALSSKNKRSLGAAHCHRSVCSGGSGCVLPAGTPGVADRSIGSLARGVGAIHASPWARHASPLLLVERDRALAAELVVIAELHRVLGADGGPALARQIRGVHRKQESRCP